MGFNYNLLEVLIVVLLLVNFIVFIVFGLDKFQAKKHHKRISENTLLVLSFVGGSLGAFFGMLIFKHNISKKSFVIKFGLIVLLQAVLVYVSVSSL